MSQQISTLETDTDGGNTNAIDSSDFYIERFSQDAKSYSPSIVPDSTAVPDDNNTGNNVRGNSIPEGAADVFLERSCDNSCWSTAGGLFLEQVLFFLTGLGSSIGYIATLSSLVYFKVLFGANSFVYLNCAVFLPLLPISLAQALWDARFDLLYQSRVTFLVRGALGYGFVMIGTYGMVTFANSHNHQQDSFGREHSGMGWVIFWALLQGIGGAVLFGLLNQLASFVGSLHHQSQDHRSNSSSTEILENDEALPKKFKATVSAGVQASALAVLVASIGSGFETMDGAFFGGFLVRILEMEALCFAAFLWLLLARPRIQVSMMRRDSSMRELNRFATELEDFHQLLSVNSSNSDTNEHARMRLPLLQQIGLSSNDNHNSSSSSSSSFNSSQRSSDDRREDIAMLSLKKLLYHSRLSCLCMALTLVPSFLVGSWFTRVQSNWMELAQVLFYVRIGSDLIGRFATILIPPASIECAVWMAGLRCIVVVLFFANASGSSNFLPPLHPKARDALSIGLVASIAFCSGYLVTACYQLAPQQLPECPRVRAANVAKQSSLLTVAFSVSAIGGLVTSFVLMAIGV